MQDVVDKEAHNHCASDAEDDAATFYDALDSLEVSETATAGARPHQPQPAASSSTTKASPWKKAWAPPRQVSWPNASAASPAATAPSPSDFPSLASASAESSTRKRNQASPWSQYASSSRQPFNPYPSRRQELVRRTRESSSRDANGRSTPPKKRHVGPSGVQTLAALLDQYAREAEDDYLGDGDGDADGPVSARGASMASLIFRDLTTGSGRSRNGRSASSFGTAGLMAFGAGSFGGEPLKVLDNMDHELGAAHMGPRIYARNPKAPEKVRSEAGRWKGKAQRLDPAKQAALDPAAVVAGASPPAGTGEDNEGHGKGITDVGAIRNARRTLDGLLRDHRESDDLITASQLNDLQAAIDTLESIISISQDATSIGDETVSALAVLLRFRPARLMQAHPNGSRAAEGVLRQTLALFTASPDGRALLGRTLAASASSSLEGDAGMLEILVSDLVGICGRRLSNPAAEIADVASSSNLASVRVDPTLLECCAFLRLLWQHNAGVRAHGEAGLSVDHFYCLMLDTLPFLEDFVAFAHRPEPDRERFNACHDPFLLSLGAKARILQFENGMRASIAARGTSGQRPAVILRTANGRASLSVSSQRLSFSIQREHAYAQSAELFRHLLGDADSIEATTEDITRPLRVEFIGEDAADGGGPTREWFAAVAKDFPPGLMGAKRWFSPSTDLASAEFLGLFLGLATFHSVKLALPFRPPAFAFKIAAGAGQNDSTLDLQDLAEADGQLSGSLRHLLGWQPASVNADESGELAEEQFEATFGLTWSLATASHDDLSDTEAVATVDLVPGGRHRTVRLAERERYVRRLIRYHLVDAVQHQVDAFRRGWTAVMPAHQPITAADGKRRGRDVIVRGGLALSLLQPEELRSIVCSETLVQDFAQGKQGKLDVRALRSHTQHILPRSDSDSLSASGRQTMDAIDDFWAVWEALDGADQRKLLAFITGSQELPVAGAKALGLRIHLVELDHILGLTEEECDGGSEGNAAARRTNRMPLPWSSTCTLTLFLPDYPDVETMQVKVAKAIEHWRGFGLR
ncbi:uncharacterized protein PFL1_00214 [Pseudozyma flocculosa PF-1]|uniref:HECT-type E3 ubiquitin transferase n=1 Tax=Pseudozyma flocculosa TaxID=84751 RepID=A0A5C3ET87_9BASI|nr:uncharacterized protein PFL1_00214 [Pseudozyma flocculosa PF-1]EPQ32016.1 hypothetical protein PFL1_00214 [Pseudozyma flocculosa PF-1]SPO35060.1 uncharacterized protein PSFLO_00531 [Pseudozyma flocculosa]